MDTDGILKPVILILLEQLVNAGIEDICLVIDENEKPLYDSLFKSIPKEYYDKLSDNKKKYEDFVELLKNHITYVFQKEKKGFGHAVYQTLDFASGEPVLLLLGDMIYHTLSEKNCMEQMIKVYEEFLVLNKGFTESKYNTDIVLPASIKTENAESYKEIIEKVQPETKTKMVFPTRDMDFILY